MTDQLTARARAWLEHLPHNCIDEAAAIIRSLLADRERAAPVSGDVEALLNVTASMTPDAIHDNPLWALDHIRALTAALRDALDNPQPPRGELQDRAAFDAVVAKNYADTPNWAIKLAWAIHVSLTAPPLAAEATQQPAGESGEGAR